FGRALRRTLIDRPSQLFHRGIAGVALAEFWRREFVLIDELGHEGANWIIWRFALEAITRVGNAEADALPQDRVGVVMTEQLGQSARAVSEDEAMHVDLVLHHRLQRVERVVERRMF